MISSGALIASPRAARTWAAALRALSFSGFAAFLFRATGAGFASESDGASTGMGIAGESSLALGIFAALDAWEIFVRVVLVVVVFLAMCTLS
jgi:hypothetical protein